MNIGGTTYCDGIGSNVPTASWGERVPCPVCRRPARVTKAHTIGAHAPAPDPTTFVVVVHSRPPMAPGESFALHGTFRNICAAESWAKAMGYEHTAGRRWWVQAVERVTKAER